MKITIDKDVFKYGGGYCFGIQTSVNELEKVLGGKMHHYKERNYPDDGVKTDYCIAGFYGEEEEELYFTIWNYKNGHYADIELTKNDVINFSVNARNEFKDWLSSQGITVNE